MTKRKRTPKGAAWLRKFDQCWYFTPPGQKAVRLLDLSGKPIKGEGSRGEADLALARIKIVGQPKGDDWTVAAVCSLYLDEIPRKVSRKAMGPDHAENMVGYVKNFMGFCGANKATDITHTDLDSWLDANPGWVAPGSKRHALIAAQSAFTHCCGLPRNGLSINPFKGYTMPTPNRRITSFKAEDEARIYRNTDQQFADFIRLGCLTGLRSFCELAKLTADCMIESERGMQLRVVGKMKAGQKERMRIIPILPEAASICKRLAETAPRGSGITLLRNANGGAWTRCCGVTRFCSLRKRIPGWDDKSKVRFSCYTTRNTYAHRMISGEYNIVDGKKVGVSLEVLSTLMGNSPKVCFSNYADLWQDYNSDLLWQAIGQ